MSPDKRLKFRHAMPHVSEATKDSLERYINEGIPTGGFLRAVLSNDLFDAYARADNNNVKFMREIVKALYNYAPSACHGSREAYKQWLDKFSENS